MLSAGARRRCEKGQLDAHVPFQHIATAPHRSRASGDMQRQTCAWHDGCLSRSNGASGTTATLTVTLLGMTCLASKRLALQMRATSYDSHVDKAAGERELRHFQTCSTLDDSWTVGTLLNSAGKRFHICSELSRQSYERKRRAA